MEENSFYKENLIYISHLDKTVSIFNTQTENHTDALLDKKFKDWNKN